MPADNSRNNDRYDVNDAIDTNSFLSFIGLVKGAIGDIDRAVNSVLKNINNGASNTNDAVKNTVNNINNANKELDKLNKFINNIRDIESTSSIAGRLTYTLTSGTRNRIDSNKTDIENLIESVRTGEQTASSVESQIRAHILENTKLQKKIDVASTVINGFSEVLTSYSKAFLGAFLGGADRYFNAYEQTFSEIAGRTGSNYYETRSLYSQIISGIDKTNITALNIVDDLVPHLEKASQAGLQGQLAISKAYSDSFDSIIMPWMDTTSDWYTNLYVNLTEGQLKQIKSADLLLQASQSGNRLLQSGVINSLNQELAPLLTNIDLNTGGVENLGNQYKAIMQYLTTSTEEGGKGMSAQDAYSIVQQMVKNDKNLFEGLTSGSTSDVIYSMLVSQGYDQISALTKMTNTVGDYLDVARSDVEKGAITSSFGFGSYIPSGFVSNYRQSIIDDEEQVRKFVEDLSKASSEMYDDAISNANEQRTNTKKVFNFLENLSVKLFGRIETAIPFGDKLNDAIIGSLGTIITLLRSMLVSNLFTGSGGGIAGLIRGIPSSIGSLGSRILSGIRGLGTQIGGLGTVVGNIARVGATTAFLVGGAAEVANGAEDMFGRMHTAGNASTAANMVEVVAGVGALIAGASPAGVALLALGAAAKYASDKLDETSAVVGEVRSEYEKQRDQIIENRNKELESANGLFEKIQIRAESILDRINLFFGRRDEEKRAQIQYNKDREELLTKVSELESSGSTDKVIEILKAAGASDVGIRNYESGRKSAEDLLTSGWFTRLFGEKDLVQQLNSDQWATLKALANIEGSHATGLQYASHDATVRIHKGERILTAAENADYSGYKVSQSVDSTGKEIVAALREIANEIIVAIRESNTENRINSASRTISSPNVNYDNNAINLMPQIGQISGSFI